MRSLSKLERKKLEEASDGEFDGIRESDFNKFHTINTGEALRKVDPHYWEIEEVIMDKLKEHFMRNWKMTVTVTDLNGDEQKELESYLPVMSGSDWAWAGTVEKWYAW